MSLSHEENAAFGILAHLIGTWEGDKVSMFHPKKSVKKNLLTMKLYY